jgi:hypothetical protein
MERGAEIACSALFFELRSGYVRKALTWPNVAVTIVAGVEMRLFHQKALVDKGEPALIWGPDEVNVQEGFLSLPTQAQDAV